MVIRKLLDMDYYLCCVTSDSSHTSDVQDFHGNSTGHREFLCFTLFNACDDSMHNLQLFWFHTNSLHLRDGT